MSKAALHAFMEKTLNDTDLQNRLAALGDDDVNGLLELASSAGYSLDINDFKSLVDTSDELDESQLDLVAGGINPQPLPPRQANTFVKLNPGLINGIIIIGVRTQ
jgi:predicted ribosomally synthesized peptide with nif11-like leader